MFGFFEVPNKLTIAWRRDVAAKWKAVNPVLQEDEIAVETDTRRFKIGNGKTEYKYLPYNKDKIPKKIVNGFTVYRSNVK